MSVTKTTTVDQCSDMLREAIRRRLHLTITYRGPSGWRSYKGIFTQSMSAESQLVACIKMDQGPGGYSLPRAGSSLGVSFRFGHKKCMFATTLRSVRESNDGLIVSMDTPPRLSHLQRRVFERVMLPSDAAVAVRFWHEDEDAKPPQDRDVRYAQLEDLSAGGMRMRGSKVSDLKLNSTFRCAFSPQPNSPVLVLDAVLMHSEEVENGRASLGFHFIGLEATPQGQLDLEKLARAVHFLQRQCTRNHRKSR